MLDNLEKLALQVSHLILLSALLKGFSSTLISLALKLFCGLFWPYMICFFLWFIGRKRIQIPLNTLNGAFRKTS